MFVWSMWVLFVVSVLQYEIGGYVLSKTTSLPGIHLGHYRNGYHRWMRWRFRILVFGIGLFALTLIWGYWTCHQAGLN